MRQRIIIVGAGLGGCTLAQSLMVKYDVTVVERGTTSTEAHIPIIDVGWPAVTQPYFGSGLGGTTRLWHNGLIEIDDEIFSSHWPIQKAALRPFYDEAFHLLSGVSAATVRTGILELKQRYHDAGLPDETLSGLYYPRWPLNVWNAFGLDGRIRVVRGTVTDFTIDAQGRVTSLIVQAGAQTQQIAGDVFVLAAGGLGTPILLQELASQLPLAGLQHAGCHYEDHPIAFVGEIKTAVPLYRLWNFRAPRTSGNIRMLLVNSQEGLQVSFQLRPAATYYHNMRRQRVDSVLNELRQHMWNPAKYIKLMAHADDILDVLSFKFGIHIPTHHYTIFMLAQMQTSSERSIWRDRDPISGKHVIRRRWQLTDEYQALLGRAIQNLLDRLAPVIKNSRVFPRWPSELRSGTHHSGTARMSASPVTGVCDANCRVHGISNLYVCDGSVIPASGIANTGLTIGALALRLAEHLMRGDNTAIGRSTVSARD